MKFNRANNEHNKKKKGFTLIELIVVMCIIGILAGALIPQISGYVTEAKKMKVLDQSRTIIMAVDSYNLKNTVKIPEDTKIGTIITKQGISKYLSGVQLDKLNKDATVAKCRDIVKGGEFEIDNNEVLVVYTFTQFDENNDIVL